METARLASLMSAGSVSIVVCVAGFRYKELNALLRRELVTNIVCYVFCKAALSFQQLEEKLSVLFAPLGTGSRAPYLQLSIVK